MTFSEFRDALLACGTTQECAAFIRRQFDDISLLFYDMARDDIARVRTQQKQAFDAFISSPVMRAVQRRETQCPDAILGLIVLFASFFERAGMYAELLDALQLLPECPAQAQLRAIFLYRRVSDARSGYRDQFLSIMQLLSPAATAGPIHAACSAAILAEYYTLAFRTITKVVGDQSATGFRELFLSPQNVRAFPLLQVADVKQVFALSASEMENAGPRLNTLAVEAVYDTACHYVSPPLPPDPADGEHPVDPEDVGVQLPAYLDELIFGSHGLGGVYAPDPDAVLDGMSADDQRQRVYIGTYLPRSYAESYRIFGPLFAHPPILSALSSKKVLTVLDVGAGTGGDIVGLLHALAESALKPARVDVLSLEGNPTAIPLQKRFVAECAANTGLNVRLNPKQLAFPTTTAGFASAFQALLTDTNGAFDIIMTWKALNEFYHKNYASAQGIYKAFIENASTVLALRGLCVMLDTSNKVKNKNTYLPIIMNREARAYVQTPAARLAHVIPRSCAYWEQNCQTEECYTQRIFYVTHSQRVNVECKTAYKVFAKRTFAGMLNTAPAEPQYRCNTAKPHRVCRQATAATVGTGVPVPNGFVLN